MREMGAEITVCNTVADINQFKWESEAVTRSVALVLISGKGQDFTGDMFYLLKDDGIIITHVYNYRTKHSCDPMPILPFIYY